MIIAIFILLGWSFPPLNVGLSESGSARSWCGASEHPRSVAQVGRPRLPVGDCGSPTHEYAALPVTDLNVTFFTKQRHVKQRHYIKSGVVAKWKGKGSQSPDAGVQILSTPLAPSKTAQVIPWAVHIQRVSLEHAHSNPS